VDWQEIDALIWQANKPLPDEWLETFHLQAPDKVQPYRRFLFLLAKRIGGSCLEIGVEHGITSAHLAASGSPTLGIDINYLGTIQQAEAHYPNYHFLHGNSTGPNVMAWVGDWVNVHGRFGVVYQDSSHHYLPSCREWDIYSDFCMEGAVWCCDDITPAFWNAQSDPPGLGMVQYFEQRPGDKRLYPDVLHHGSAIGIIKDFCGWTS
jgi:hypothetical protein